LEGSVKYLKSI